MDVVKRAVPVVQLELDKSYMGALVKAVINLGVTHSFISERLFIS